MSDDATHLVAGPGPLLTVLPEALERLAEAKALRQVAVVYLPEVPAPVGVDFLLWSNKHSAWWKSNAHGYTADIDEAGRYSEAEAVKYVTRSAFSGRLDQVTCMVAAPANSPEVGHAPQS